MKSRVLFSLSVAVLLLLVVAIALEFRHLRIASLPASGQHGKLDHNAISHYALLPAGEAATYAKLFSASSTTDVRSWEPTVADIEGLEANLVQVPALSENVAGSTRHIDKPDQYFRQYLAVVQHGKRWIFVNSLCRIDEHDSDAWRKHLEMIDDGGECYWQAWYDPATRRFSNLLVNGVA